MNPTFRRTKTPTISRWLMSVCFPVVVLSTITVTSHCDGQTVQLPTTRQFGYSGSVLVPDRGTASLGGVSRSGTFSTRRPGSRSYSSSLSSAGASASVTIIDLAEMDRQILGGTPEEFLRRRQAEQRQAQVNTPQGAPKPQVSSAPVDLNAEGKSLVRFARKCLAENRRSMAFESYRMSLSKLDPRLRQLALTEFKRHFGVAAEQVASQSAPARRPTSPFARSR